MTSRAKTEYRYEKLTWPEINDAIELGKVCILPCGAVEQHGHHLPLDVDLVCPGGIAKGAGQALPEKILVLPTICYGYTGHVMDFPGTINSNYTTFMEHVLDVTRSLAYHGFKKIILLNGHGSNMPNLDLVARRTNLETDAECLVIAWWNLLTVDKKFLPSWRESKFPGGCSHACELETSLYLYLDEENVRKDKIKSGVISFNEEESAFNWCDLFASGPATVVSWTSTYTGTGVLGDAELASKEKGQRAYVEAVRQLCNFVNYFHPRPKDARRELHRRPPTIPIPWKQRSQSQPRETAGGPTAKPKSAAAKTRGPSRNGARRSK
ncbi:MAG TPA: creatininase family protein [Planctomycetaceae bacterium]|nr:creatininase family protein [Planctomycetaceae bacterium]